MSDNVKTDCLVCAKHRGETPLAGGVIFENDLISISHAQLFGDEKDHYLGHLFIESKRHVAEYADLTDEEAQQIGLWVKRLSQALLATLDMDHVYAFMIVDGVPHVHLHVIGRYRGAPREYWGPRVDDWPGAPRGGAEEIAEVSLRIRQFISVNGFSMENP